MTLLILVLILGLLIFVHELGHFITAKKSNVYIYEFSLGMGPRILSYKSKKDEVIYSLKLFPIGGSVQMAGEVYEDDDLKKVPKDRFMCNRPWHQKVIVLIAGVTCNFILAILLLFIQALIWGSNDSSLVIGNVVKNYPCYDAGVEVGDKILEINNKKIYNWDEAIIVLNLKNKKDYYTFKIEKENGNIKTYKVVPKIEENHQTGERKVFGIGMSNKINKGLLNALKYSFTKFISIINSMIIIIGNLFIGNLSLNTLSGPVGIYSVVGESTSLGIQSLMYLIAYLSINLGFINLLPFPAFDGGRVLFLIIEKIKGKPVNKTLENVFHTVGFILLMILMAYITFQDIIKLF